MTKKMQTYRIQEEQIEQLPKLVKHYQDKLKKETGVEFPVSRATVLEKLIAEKYQELYGE